MARIPILQGPGQIQTGNQTLRVPELQAVNNNAVAQGLAKVGQVSFDISERAKRAQDVTNLTNASMSMQNAQLEFAKFQQENPDESTWMGKWDEIQSRLKTDFDKMPLTPDARLNLQERVTNWSTRGTIMVQAEAFKKTGQRMEDSGRLAAKQAIQMGDVTIFKQHADNMVAAGFSTPEARDLQVAQVEDAAVAKRVQDLKEQKAEFIRLGNQGDVTSWQKVEEINSALTDLGEYGKERSEQEQKSARFGKIGAEFMSYITGEGGLPVDLTKAEELRVKSDLTPQVKEEMKMQIQQAKTRYANQDLLNFMNRVARNEVVDGNDFSSQYMEPAQLMEARAEINAAMPVTPENEARVYLDTMTMIDGIDPTLVKNRDPKEVVEMARATMRIKKSPPHLRDLLSTAMQSKLAGTDDKSAAADGQRLGREMLREIVKFRESKFFTGSGEDKRLDPKKASDWMNFQQRVFMLEKEIERRVKGVDDLTKVNKIVSDVLSADYVEVAKQRYLDSSSNALPVGPVQGDSATDSSFFPSINFPQ
jgi:hypothetical protein